MVVYRVLSIHCIGRPIHLLLSTSYDFFFGQAIGRRSPSLFCIHRRRLEPILDDARIRSYYIQQ
ncbi:hypothetical protein LINGRAHAP2_LOCUS2453 [Linum grandiflorum]